MQKKNIVFSTVAYGRSLLEDDAAWNPLPAIPALANPQISKLYLFIPFSMQKAVNSEIHAFERIANNIEISPVFTNLKKDFTPASIGDFYSYFNEYFEKFPFTPEKNNYFIHFAPGNSFSHAFMLTLLINLRKLPIRLLQLRLTRDGVRGEIYDCAINLWVSEIAKREMDRTDSQTFLKSSIETKNIAFNRLIGNIEQAATHSEAPVLLVGPTGSGKSQLARRIYELRRKHGKVDGKFVEINCATLRGESALSTLFGHVRGAYTGAITNRKGFVAQANRGILFLDEIGELSQDMQILLLKVIEEKTFIPFGSDIPAFSDFQLICATNRDLNADCRLGRFRLDLLSRINLWEFHLPSLRDRPEDIEPNIDYELRRIASSRGALIQFAKDAKSLFLDFAVSPEALWPGNFRSLSACMERMATYSPHGFIKRDIVEKEIQHLKKIWQPLQTETDFPNAKKLAPDYDKLDLFDKFQLEGVLQVCVTAPSRSAAGQTLFNNSRNEKSSRDDTTRLRKYLATYGIEWENIKNANLRQNS